MILTFSGGGQEINQTKQDLISEFLKNNSKIASNRVTKSKDFKNADRLNDTLLPVRYLEDNKTELFKKYYLTYGNISKSTFFKYLNINKQYKNPHRLTDLCDYCEWARNTKSEISRYLTDAKEFELKENFKVEELIGYFDLKKRNTLSMVEKDEIEKKLLILEKYQIVMEHINIADTQRKSYNQQRKNKLVLTENILIELDFKQKIPIGLSPRQINKEYYEQELRTCLGNNILFFIYSW